MSIVASIPLSITAEADEHIERLRMRAEFERMLDYIRGHFAELRRIEVVLQPPYDTGGGDHVLMLGILRAGSDSLDDPSWDNWRQWRLSTFSPEVLCEFTMLLGEEGTHGGS